MTATPRFIFLSKHLSPFGVVICAMSVGCVPSPPTQVQLLTSPIESVLQVSTTQTTSAIHAQGRLQPARGIARLSGMPGDQVEKVLVKVGDQVSAEQMLVQLKGERFKQLELEIAELKLKEAESLQRTRIRELELAVLAAQGKQTNGEQLVEIARAQLDGAKQGLEQHATLQSQVETLAKLRDDPLTRPAVGKRELELKELELQQARLSADQTILSATHQLQQAELQLELAKENLRSVEETLERGKAESPLLSLERQVELLRLQLKESVVRAPYNATILSIPTKEGENLSTFPIVELADLSEMVCVAEVYEADVARIQIGDRARLKSISLREELTGKVTRIERIVGASQLRSPNPTARTDFRAISVWIEIPLEQVAIAAERIHLQVDVTIEASNATAHHSSDYGASSSIR